MINKNNRAAIANDTEFDVTCAANGNMLIREMTFHYAVQQWNPRVIK